MSKPWHRRAGCWGPSFRGSVLLPVERETPCGDTVAVTADGGAEEPLSGLIDVSAEIVVPQHDVREIAVAVGHP